MVAPTGIFVRKFIRQGNANFISIYVFYALSVFNFQLSVFN